MERCSLCKIEKLEDDFYMYAIYNMTDGRVQKSYKCKNCSDISYGDKWYPIVGYDQKCEISNSGFVRELRENRFFDITYVQNASTRYVYLTKDGKNMRKNIGSLMKRFCTER
ncbi:hypothetical protein MKZ08_08560 [Viridibacillus sp. FSL R5-0477]|uniref:Uncharacterized protein n=1 Tax=Viridibacillus arenosi FSL R5-213 TaxID=1227360 RepID=W4EVQ6_9BACL|nr:hypothetical protein [Viridibacillus arenosi]ETT84157.1 hypothetical protein C176_12353 [Viridibacillus arenosi FSL R5-213]OMC90048.1 hypothetical protein BK137_14980 [Viridibacillus arenosi]